MNLKNMDYDIYILIFKELDKLKIFVPFINICLKIIYLYIY